MKNVATNNWLINQQKEGRLKRYKKITLFRRYWNSPTHEFLWEDKKTIDIDRDIIKCGKVTWKADTEQLNIWKTGNLSLTVDNSHGKWDVSNSNNYFDGFEPFLSMMRIEVGFIAEDKTMYQVFSYSGLIGQQGIQIENEKHIAKLKLISLDYLLQSVDGERVSHTPSAALLKYYNADIYSATTIGKTSAGWSPVYQYRMVRIIEGTGIGQEREILSHTSDTITVNIWDTVPDSTSGFEIVGENIGTGNDAETEFTTSENGVGRIIRVWLGDELQIFGTDYEIEQLDQKNSPAKIIFNIAPVGGVKVIVNYFWWYIDTSFDGLINIILNLAQVTDRSIERVTFPYGQGASTFYTIDTEAGFNNGTNLQLSTSKSPDDIIMEDDFTTEANGYYMGYGSEPSIGTTNVPIGSGVGNILHYQKFYATKNAFISQIRILMNSVGASGNLIIQFLHDNSDNPGTNVFGGSVGFEVPVQANGDWWAEFAIPGINPEYRLVRGNAYWIRIFWTEAGGAVNTKVETNSANNHEKYFRTWAGDYGVSEQAHYANFEIYFRPYYTYGIHTSQTNDLSTDITALGKLQNSQTLNNGTIKYYTRTQDINADWPTIFQVEDWDLIDGFGNITSTPRRYIRVVAYITPNYPGIEYSTSDIDTPYLHSYTVNYSISSFVPDISVLTGKNGKSTVESIASLADYEMGFFTDFNDGNNIQRNWGYDSWDPTTIPTSQGWTKFSSPDGDEEIIYTGIIILPPGEGTYNLRNFGTSGYIYYSRENTNLDPSIGWTAEITSEQITGTDENFGIKVNDGTYLTKILITQNYIKLVEYDNENINKTKKINASIGFGNVVRFSRKNELVKIYIDDKLVLCSIGNMKCPANEKKIFFGYFSEPSSNYETRVGQIYLDTEIACFDRYYLPTYYFQNKTVFDDTNFELTADNAYFKIYNFENGWNRVKNNIIVEYGDYTYKANSDSEFDEQPSSEDRYGTLTLNISSDSFLIRENTNITDSIGKSYYQLYKLPKRRFNLLCKYLFQFDLSDKIYVTSELPIELDNLPCKVVGIVLDIDKYTLDLDVEEII